MGMRLLPIWHAPRHELAGLFGIRAEVQGAGCVGTGRIDLVARVFRIEAAAQLMQMGADAHQHVAQNLSFHRLAMNLHDEVVLVFDGDLFLEGLVETDRPLRKHHALHLGMHVRLPAEGDAVIDVGAVGRHEMHVAAVLGGLVLTLPAIVGEQVLDHVGGEVDRQVAAARAGEGHVELTVLGILPRGRADDLADEVDGESRLRGMQQVEVAEIGDLDPALAILAPPLDEQRVIDRAEPARHHEGGLLDQALDLGRAAGDLGRGGHEFARLDAPGLGDARNGIDDPPVEQRIGQEQHLVGRPDGEDRDHVVDGLKIISRVRIGQRALRRHGRCPGRFENILPGGGVKRHWGSPRASRFFC